MKRNLPADFDPVYPYDAKMPAITPPFVTPGGGIDPDTPGLSINTKPPMHIENGAVALDYGNGLHVQNGKLVTNADAEAPLESTPQHLKLNFADGLKLNATGQLIVQSKDPISIDNGSLTLKHDNSLVINSNGQLSTTSNLIPQPPLIKINNSLFLKSGNGLSTINGILSLKHVISSFTKPLVLDGEDLKLNIGQGLTVTPDGNLTANTTNITASSPLNFDPASGNLSLSLGIALETIGQHLDVKLSPRGALTIKNGGIATNIDNSLKIIQENDRFSKLGANIQANSGLKIDSVGIGILLHTLNPGLDLQNGLHVIAAQNKGIEVDSAGIKIKLASGNSGLDINSDLKVLVNNNKGLDIGTSGIELKLKPESSLEFTSNGLGVVYDPQWGLHLASNKLCINGGKGLTFVDENNIKRKLSIHLKTNGGLKFEPSGNENGSLRLNFTDLYGLTTTAQGELRVKLNTNGGLEFQSGKGYIQIKLRPGGGLNLTNQGLGLANQFLNSNHMPLTLFITQSQFSFNLVDSIIKHGTLGGVIDHSNYILCFENGFINNTKCLHFNELDLETDYSDLLPNKSFTIWKQLLLDNKQGNVFIHFVVEDSTCTIHIQFDEIAEATIISTVDFSYTLL